MAHYTHPEYWLAPLLPNGGDTASHLLYVGVFREWFWGHGQISGWMPEVFAGFPALVHYFPFPFILIALLSPVTGLALAFKGVILLPVFLLPSAVCWSTGRMGWPWAARLLAATATVGFLLNEGSAIWGGNILAQFGGEFAFGWGLLAVILFLGSLVSLHQRGGMGWLLAAVLAETLSAMSHGFAILTVGFGSLLYGLLAGGGWPMLRLLLRLHLLSFLLLGFWLLPLLANLPWTIPNDTAFFVTANGWAEFWPTPFWWVGLGVPVWMVWMVRGGAIRSTGLPFLAMGLMGLIGFVLAPRLGLADVRFLPFAQLGFAVLLAGALGWWLHFGGRLHPLTPPTPRGQRLAMTLAILLTMGLAAYWDLSITKVSEWSLNLLSGYEGRPQWSIYRALANQLRGGMASPRVLFEHDLANNDLGSTRSLEALPFFGTRPVLEGLYMEAATAAPFIYQVQAEVSAQPSGPLSRYPPLSGTVTQAVNHMRELGADTLVLRSARMKQRFSEDARFHPEAEIGPFRVLRLTGSPPPLAELLTVPLQTEGRTGWLDRAYRRFLLDHPYAHREVYLQAGEQLPATPPDCQTGNVRLEIPQRERLRITTDRPGCPLLIRMSYHPRWRALSGEPIHLVEPFFMLLFPLSQQVDLAYLPNAANEWGWGLTASGILWLLVLAFGRRCAPQGWRIGLCAPEPQGIDLPSASGTRLTVGLIGVGVLLVLGWLSTPDRSYQAGHALFNQQRFQEAAQRLDQAAEERIGWSRHAEALFWAGMAWERGGEPQKAVERYHRLMETYPAGMFTAEAIHRLILWYRQQGDPVRARLLLDHLTAHYPGSRWLPLSQESPP